MHKRRSPAQRALNTTTTTTTTTANTTVLVDRGGAKWSQSRPMNVGSGERDDIMLVMFPWIAGVADKADIDIIGAG